MGSAPFRKGNAEFYYLILFHNKVYFLTMEGKSEKSRLMNLSKVIQNLYKICKGYVKHKFWHLVLINLLICSHWVLDVIQLWRWDNETNPYVNNEIKRINVILNYSCFY